MLTKLPTHAGCSALYFQDFAPDPVAHDKPTVWSFTQKDFVKEDEDWVLLWSLETVKFIYTNADVVDIDRMCRYLIVFVLSIVNVVFYIVFPDDREMTLVKVLLEPFSDAPETINDEVFY